MNENRLIPYQTSDLLPGPWLVFAPHPDDETFGMGGSILLAREAGIDVDVVIMTDGGQDFDTDEKDIVGVREAEVLAACDRMGVRDCLFWRQQDRALCASAELEQRIIDLLDERQPQHVFIPSCLEYHPDHRATAEIVWSALQAASDCHAVAVGYDITNLGPCNLLIDISSVKAEKQKVMEVYASQVETHRYIELVQAINTARTFSLGDQSEAAEGFYLFPRLPGMDYAQASQAWFSRFFQSQADNEPLVSVIVRTKDRLDLLSQALSSLALQQHKNLELIVVNDGGVSPSSLLSGFATVFSNINLVDNSESCGRAAAANQGLEQVTGEYFIFLDDDDWLDPPHISNLLEVHRSNNELVAAYTGVRTVQADGAPERIFNEPFDRHRLFYENYIPIHAVLIHRSVIDRGIRMDESLDVFEDWDFWLQLCRITIAFKHLDGVSANYRISDDRGIGVTGGHDEVRRRLYARWAKTWGINEIDDLLTRLVVLSKKPE